MTPSASSAGLPGGPDGTTPAATPDTADREDDADHHAPVRADARRRVDAIIVSVERTSAHLADAAQLAGQLGCDLIVMRPPDRGARPDDVVTELSRWPRLRWHVLAFADPPTHPLLAFGRPAVGPSGPLSRRAVMRNASLLLGRILGWRAVLFLDDDIAGLDQAEVERAASGLDTHRTVGLTHRRDNSVTWHVHADDRGGGRSVFIEGAALLIDCTQPFGFFTDIRNGIRVVLFDWSGDEAVSTPGSMGRIALRHRARTKGGRTGPRDWAKLVYRRGRSMACRRRRPATTGDVVAVPVVADRGCEVIGPDDTCARFVAGHAKEAARWRQQVDRLPTAADFAAAAACLGLVVGASSDGADRRPTTGRGCAAGSGPCGDLVVVLPGFLDTVRYPSTTMLVEALSAHASKVVPLELHGAWTGHEGLVSEYRMSRHLDQILHVLNEHRCACRRRTVLVGFCYGAQLAALAAERDPRVTDVVALMPMRKFIWADDYDRGKDTWRRKGPRPFPRDLPPDDPSSDDDIAVRVFDVPYAVVQDALGHDSAAAFKALCRQRVLFVSGADDAYTPVTVVERLRRGCDNPSALHVSLSGVQHDYRGSRTQVDRVNATVVGWLWPTTGSSPTASPTTASSPRPYRHRRGQARL